MTNHTLIIVGSGIKFMSHLTIEAKASIEKSDKVLYLVNEPAMQEWIQLANPNSEALDFLYTKNILRNDNYSAIAEYIIDTLKQFKTLCVVIYGHPTVFVQPSIYAANAAIKEGYNVIILPGISAEDCLYADLMIDPGACGSQSFEATDFLIYCREYDAFSHLILWQPSIIGVLDIPTINHNQADGLNILVEYLNIKYSLEHEITLYEAAQYPSFKPRIENVRLKDLSKSNLSRLTTIYVPPVGKKTPDINVVNKLKNIKKA